LSVNSIKRTT